VQGAKEVAGMIKHRVHSPLCVDKFLFGFTFHDPFMPTLHTHKTWKGLTHRCSRWSFCYTWHYSPATHLLHEAYGHAWIRSELPWP